MKVNIGTIEVSDADRRDLRKINGLPGLATRDEVRLAMAGAIEAEKYHWFNQAAMIDDYPD